MVVLCRHSSGSELSYLQRAAVDHVHRLLVTDPLFSGIQRPNLKEGTGSTSLPTKFANRRKLKPEKPALRFQISLVAKILL